MDGNQKTEAIELIRRIQFHGGSHDDFVALEQATGNGNVWTIFGALEVEAFAPEKLLKLLGEQPNLQKNCPVY